MQRRRERLVRGSKADRIFFEKIIEACKGEITNHVRLEYPVARKREFDPIVTHVAKSLRSGKGWQCWLKAG